ncbi:hypothetical protein GM3708_1816 [Geminocystis sp. NIES-3708]|nr:hypothetical protein GM3708_1816 [Geminocystis sp. NIES-3708]
MDFSLFTFIKKNRFFLDFFVCFGNNKSINNNGSLTTYVQKIKHPYYINNIMKCNP